MYKIDVISFTFCQCLVNIMTHTILSSYIRITNIKYTRIICVTNLEFVRNLFFVLHTSMALTFILFLKPQIYSRCVHWLDRLNRTHIIKIWALSLVVKPIKTTLCTFIKRKSIAFNIYLKMPVILRITLPLSIVLHSLTFFNYFFQLL